MAKTMNEELGVAIIGAGYMAQEHARAFAGMDGVRLSAVFSRSPARASALAAAYPGMLVCNSVKGLWEQSRADLVVVTVNELAMLEVAKACFAFPWTVLLEKPAGYDLENAGAILNAARSAGARAFVAFNRRAYSSTRGALDRLAKIDGPRFIRVLDQQDQAEALNVYKFPETVVRNYMYANSIHVIDYLRVFGRGEITRVTPVAAWTPESPGVVLSKVEFSSGDIGLYEGIWNGPGPWSVIVSTAQERLEMRPLEQLTVQLRGERRAMQQPLDPADTEYKPGLRYQALQAIRAARGDNANLATLEDSWCSMKLVADIFGLSS
ncbi:MAG: Oxidoreductase [Betaproteobacteria bacterium]|nr:Oxidoreductase [Betaproteobacteria bacterium]